MQTALLSSLKVSRVTKLFSYSVKSFSSVPTSFVRYRNNNGEIKYGEPIDTPMNGCNVKVITGDILKNPELTTKIEKASEILYPIEAPQIIAIGLNYAKHAAEAKLEVPRYPAVFIKTINSLNNPYSNVVIPECCKAKDEMDFEGELAVIIKDKCKNVPESEAFNHILGYCIADDVSARRWQGKKGSNQWCRCKSFDTFTPLGPSITLHSTSINPDNLLLKTLVNNKVMQQSNTNDMIFHIPQLISYLSQDTTLLPGTVILTGTPGGVGYARKPPVYLHDGDVIHIEIEKLGFIEHKIVN